MARRCDRRRRSLEAQVARLAAEKKALAAHLAALTKGEDEARGRKSEVQTILLRIVSGDEEAGARPGDQTILVRISTSNGPAGDRPEP